MHLLVSEQYIYIYVYIQ